MYHLTITGDCHILSIITRSHNVRDITTVGQSTLISSAVSPIYKHRQEFSSTKANKKSCRNCIIDICMYIVYNNVM